MDKNQTQYIKQLEKELEKYKLEEEMQITNEILKNMYEGICVFGLNDFIIKYTNNRFEKMFGYNPGEIIGKNMRAIVAKNGVGDNAEIERISILRKTKEWHGEIKNIKQDGTIFWTYTNCSVFECQKYGWVIVGVYIDITKHKIAEETLNKSVLELQAKNQDLATTAAILNNLKEKYEVANSQLKVEIARANAMTLAASQASMSKNMFLANIGHELRSPLNDIVGFSDILLNNSNIAPEEQISYIEIINKRTCELVILVNDLLDISKIEAGKLSMSYETIKFKTLINEVGNCFTKEIKNKKIKYNVNIEKNVPIYLNTDPFRLKQVLTNLIDNAIKFTENGKINLHVAKIINKDLDLANKVELEICISDTGIGIPKHNQSELFKPFSQVQDSTHKKYGGTGLGLAISKRLVKIMDGSIRMEDNIPKGSIFCLTIIANMIKENKIYPIMDGMDLSNKTREILDKRTISLLVVEDQLTSIDILKFNIKEKSKKIIFNSVVDGQQAINAYKQGKIDVILTDIVMPVMDGFDLIKQVRAMEKNTSKHTPIIAMTASASEKDKEKCLESGADFYITKPIIKSDLYQTLDKMIGKFF